MGTVLTINPGSTAVKYVLFNDSGAELDRQTYDRKEVTEITKTEREWLNNIRELSVVSIRIVHGGDLSGPVVWSRGVEITTRKFARFAPIHNNLALDIISLIKELHTSIKIVVSFDTDFHTAMPKEASTYPINKNVAQKYGLKRYGFHGLVLESVLSQLAEEPALAGGLPNKVICAHIGGGVSVTAVLNSKSVDTSMGLTPLEGPMMITRSGSVDPSLAMHISNLSGDSTESVVEMLNNKSGFYGLTGSKNTLDIINRASKRQNPERLAVDIFVNGIVKQIFAHYGTLQGCDALVISGGIGYGNPSLRAQLLKKLKIIGITEDNTYIYQADEAQVLFENASKF